MQAGGPGLWGWRPTFTSGSPYIVPAAPPAMFGQFRTACRFALRNQARIRVAGPLLVVFVPACAERLGPVCGLPIMP